MTTLVLAALLAAPPADPDENVRPAQFTQPVATPTAGLPATPPAPSVQLLLLVPQDSPPGAELAYVLRIVNSSAADAHRVTVRMPIPESATFVKAEPKPDAPAAAELVWKFKTLKAGATDEIKIVLKPKDGVREVAARGYVSYEHGQQVTTRINSPKLKLRTESPKTALAGDPIPVRVTVQNDGRVPVMNVKLTANVSAGAEFDRDSTGEKTQQPNQRVWDIGTLPPGMTRTVDYKLNAKAAGELAILTNADGSGLAQATDTAKTTVREAKLKIDLRGDPTAAADKGAEYEMVVTNTGTQPLANVRVTALVPEGCRVRKLTDGSKRENGQLIWTLPRLAAGDNFAYRFRPTADEPGRKTVRAAVVARGAEDVQTVQTLFTGAADLHWETKFDQATVARDRSGMFTVMVKNTGTDVARGVKLVVNLPKEVGFVQATPGQKADAGKLTFDPQDIAANGSVTYSVTFRGEQGGQATFVAELSDASGGKPLETQKYVEITDGR